MFKLNKSLLLYFLRKEKSFQKKISEISLKSIFFRFYTLICRSKTKNYRVFVYSPGKTGTTSVHSNLSYFYFKKFHSSIFQNIKHDQFGQVYKSHIDYPPFEKEGEKYTNIYFVQFREPISRTLSYLNENEIQNLFDKKNRFQLDKFEKEFQSSLNKYFLWWDKFFTDFKIYDEMNYIRYKGYEIININNNNILVFHLTENLNSTYAKSINEIFNTQFSDDILLNLRKTKSVVYNRNYDIVKNQKFDLKIVNKIYENRYVKKFYKRNQIKFLISKFSS